LKEWRDYLTKDFGSSTSKWLKELKMKLKKIISKEEIKQIFEKELYFDASCEIRNPDWLITSDELKNGINEFQIVSVIGNSAINYPFKIDIKTSISNIKNDEFQPEKNKKYIFVCNQGNTSYQALTLIKEKHANSELYSLIGGITNY
jgi:adenylyltransferase/sulfurtransferase